MLRFWPTALLSAALLAPVAPTMLQAQDHDRDHRDSHQVYHDKKHHDEHQWNDHEDRAYRIYLKDHHRKYEDFNRLRERDQEAYWNWRHSHSDAVLRIDIR